MKQFALYHLHQLKPWFNEMFMFKHVKHVSRLVPMFMVSVNEGPSTYLFVHLLKQGPVRAPGFRTTSRLIKPVVSI